MASKQRTEWVADGSKKGGLSETQKARMAVGKRLSRSVPGYSRLSAEERRRLVDAELAGESAVGRSSTAPVGGDAELSPVVQDTPTAPVVVASARVLISLPVVEAPVEPSAPVESVQGSEGGEPWSLSLARDEWEPEFGIGEGTGEAELPFVPLALALDGVPVAVALPIGPMAVPVPIALPNAIPLGFPAGEAGKGSRVAQEKRSPRRTGLWSRVGRVALRAAGAVAAGIAVGVGVCALAVVAGMGGI